MINNENPSVVRGEDRFTLYIRALFAVAMLFGIVGLFTSSFVQAMAFVACVGMVWVPLRILSEGASAVNDLITIHQLDWAARKARSKKPKDDDTKNDPPYPPTAVA